MLIDTHAHLYWDSFKDDLEEVIQRSLEAEVKIIINAGVDLKTSQLAADLKSDEIEFYSSIGLHPHEASKYFNPDSSRIDVSIHQDLEKLGEVYKQNPDKVIAVGECGLDFAFDPQFMKTPNGTLLSQDRLKDLQIMLFKAQIGIAEKLNLPLLVHCRDDRSQNSENNEAWDLVLKIVGNHPAILHCYSGLPKTTDLVLNSKNLLVSFAATITYPKNEYLREAAKTLPMEKIVLETDCPFLPPQSRRGQRNEPATVVEIAQLIADIKEVSLDKVADQTSRNVSRLLKLK